MDGRGINRDWDWRGAQVLVTGAAGFIGRHLCRHLTTRGAVVHGVALRSTGEGVETESWHLGDLSESGTASALVRKLAPDFIFHLASLVQGGRDRALVVPMFEANLASTVRLLDAAADRNARVVLCGSLEEPDCSHEPPCSPYAAAKAAATSYGRLYADLYDLPVVTARIFMVYGPGPQDMKKLVPYVITELLADRAPRLSSGKRPIDWIHVRDVVEGLIHFATLPLAPMQAAELGTRPIDLGSGTLVTVGEVVSTLSEMVDSSCSAELGALPDRPGEIVRSADVETTTRHTGWRPKISLEQGLAETVAYFRASLEHENKDRN